jgi:hypothetical protein
MPTILERELLRSENAANFVHIRSQVSSTTDNVPRRSRPAVSISNSRIGAPAAPLANVESTVAINEHAEAIKNGGRNHNRLKKLELIESCGFAAVSRPRSTPKVDHLPSPKCEKPLWLFPYALRGALAEIPQPMPLARPIPHAETVPDNTTIAARVSSGLQSVPSVDVKTVAWPPPATGRVPRPPPAAGVNRAFRRGMAVHNRAPPAAATHHVT